MSSATKVSSLTTRRQAEQSVRRRWWSRRWWPRRWWPGRWAPRWSTLRWALTLVTVAFVIGGAAWLLLATPVFGVRVVEVTDAQRVTPAAVRHAAEIPRGTPLARLDGPAVEQRVSERLRAVADVELHRVWPWTVRLAVRERQAAGVISARGRFSLVDSDGVVFAVTRKRPPGVPLLEGGGRTVPQPRAVAAALAVSAALPARLRAEVASVQAETPDSVRLRLTSGATVVWGSPEDSARKARVLAALLPQDAETYDVSAPGVPTVRGAGRG